MVRHRRDGSALVEVDLAVLGVGLDQAGGVVEDVDDELVHVVFGNRVVGEDDGLDRNRRNVLVDAGIRACRNGGCRNRALSGNSKRGLPRSRFASARIRERNPAGMPEN